VSGQCYFLGLDLGQANDYTALAIAEQQPRGSGQYEPDSNGVVVGPHGMRPMLRETTVSHYDIRHLERAALGTSYPRIVERVRELVSQPPLQGQVTVVADGTGVGAPVVDLLLDADLSGTELVPVIITGGQHVTWERGYARCPKQTLIATLQVLLQSQRLKVAPALPEAQTLVRELLNFRVKITVAAHETYEAWREGVHDDLVLATALACWYGEYQHGHRTMFF
jgi:hypothetical protein